MADPRVLLVFPPQWTPMNPHFSLAALNGHLKRQQVRAEVLDLNVRFYRAVLTRGFLQLSLKRAHQVRDYLMVRTLLNLKSGNRSPRADRENARLMEIDRLLGLDHSRVLEEIDDAVAVFDDVERFYDPPQLIRAYLVLDRALDLASLPYYPIRFSFNDFSIPGLPLTTEGIRAYADDREENMFLPFFEAAVRDIQARKPDLVGISINAHAQLAPGLTLARLLKQWGGTHVTLGGNHFLRVKDGVVSQDFLNSFADSVILGEGEVPLDCLIEAVTGRRTLQQVPGLAYLDSGAAAFTGYSDNLSMNERAVPCLDGLPLNDYFCAEPVVTIRSSKGCYWRKCTFCDTDFGVHADQRTVASLVDEMESLHQTYGIEDFCFIDECIVPRYMEQVAQALHERGTRLHWYGNGRLDTAFTRPRLERLHQGGLTMLLWGLESGSDRVMGLINKGIKWDRRLEILRDSAQAGVWNFAYIFFGFPSETEEEGMSTIRLLEENSDIIHSYGRSVFTLNKGATVHKSARTLATLEMVADPEELSANLHYRLARDDDGARQQALRLAQLCKTRCAEAYGDPLWMYLRFREVIHLYLKRHGRDYLVNYRIDPADRLDWAGLGRVAAVDNP